MSDETTRNAAKSRVRVSFDAEVLLLGDEVPESLDRDALAQAVQDSLGYSGVRVTDVFDWQVEEPRA